MFSSLHQILLCQLNTAGLGIRSLTHAFGRYAKQTNV